MASRDIPHGNSKGYQLFIHHVHIADGFADDCEELIHRWLKADTLTYETFCEIWKDMQFNYLYHGRGTGAEMAELSEELIHIAKHYMVANTDNFEESVAGLFLVYGLLRLQPYSGFASLRLVPEDVSSMARLESRARRDRRYDVLYILASVLIEGPVQYHAANRERGMESAIRKYLEGTTGIDRLGVRPKGVFFRQNEELDLLRDLDIVTSRYVAAKKVLKGEMVGLNYAKEDLASELDTSLKSVINGIVDDGPEVTKKLQEHFNRVQALKERAMRRAVASVRHRASVAQHRARQYGTLTPTEDATPPPKPLGKASLGIPRHRRHKPEHFDSAGPGPSKRRRASSTSDTQDDLSDESDRSDASGRRVEFAKDFSLEQLDKDDLQPAEEEKEIDIEINSLPVFIRTEQEGRFEIEVIDKMEERVEEEDRLDTRAMMEQLTDVTFEKVDPGEGTSKDNLQEDSSKKKKKKTAPKKQSTSKVQTKAHDLQNSNDTEKDTSVKKKIKTN